MNQFLPGATYTAQVLLQVSSGSPSVKLTMHTSLGGGSDVYTNVASGTAQTGCWTQLKGTYTLSNTADTITMYVEGPPSGVDVYVMVAAIVLTSGGGSSGGPGNMVRRKRL